MSQDTMSLQEFGKRLHQESISIADALAYMAEIGNVSIDSDWECETWTCTLALPSAELFESTSHDLRTAMLGTASKHFVAVTKRHCQHCGKEIAWRNSSSPSISPPFCSEQCAKAAEFERKLP